MSKKTIDVLVFEPGVKRGRVVQLLNTLEAMQHLVADCGLIETATVGDGLVVVMDEEGKLKRKKANRPLKSNDGRIYDVIAGTFFLTSSKDGEFTGLSQSQIETWQNWAPVSAKDIDDASNFDYLA